MKAVFLDRDGVINAAIVREGKPFSPSCIEEVVIPEDVPGALKKLKAAGFLCIVVTNQPDIARGKLSQSALDSVHDYLKTRLPLDAIFACCHDDCDKCHCRKPKPGLITDAALKYDVDLSQSYMIGDRWRDVEAGLAAGCTSIFLDYNYDEKKPLASDCIAQNLSDAVDWILKSVNELNECHLE